MRRVPYLFNNYDESMQKSRYEEIMGMTFGRVLNDDSVKVEEFEFCIQNPKAEEMKEVLVEEKDVDEICYGRDDLLAVAEKMAEEMGDIDIAESLIEEMANAAYKHLSQIKNGKICSCTKY